MQDVLKMLAFHVIVIAIILIIFTSLPQHEFHNLIISGTTEKTVSSLNKERAENDIPVYGESNSHENHSFFHTIAKNLSYSRGVFVEKNPNKPEEGVKLRRSVRKKLLITSLGDVLIELLDNFEDNSGSKLTILKKIEFLVHEYDVAVNFAKFGGMESILPYLLSPDDEVSSAVASVLGTAMQGNEEVKKIAIKLKAGDSLLKNLKSVNNNTVSQMLYALSAYLRNMPVAQERFFENDGIVALSNLLKNPTVGLKSKLKIVNLLHDIAVEQQAGDHDVTWDDYQDVQYIKKLFRNQMKMSQICEDVPLLLDVQVFDVHQKVIAALQALVPFCSDAFKTTRILSKVKQLKSFYDENFMHGVSPFLLDDELKELLIQDINLFLQEIAAFSSEENKAIYETKKTEL